MDAPVLPTIEEWTGMEVAEKRKFLSDYKKSQLGKFFKAYKEAVEKGTVRRVSLSTEVTTPLVLCSGGKDVPS